MSMESISRLTFVTPVELESVLRDAGWSCASLFTITTEGVSGKGGFFNAVRLTFPLDPPLQSARSWDALADSLFEGLLSVKSARILIVWNGAWSMYNESPEAFETAVEVLGHVAGQLADPRATAGQHKDVQVYVVASDAMPRSLS